jgi:plasmid stability protein
MTETITPAVERALSSTRRAIGGGRLGIYTALGGLTGSVPLPWLPDALARRVRGALAHDIAARHGLSLSPEAREILAEPSPGGDHPRGLVGQAARFVGRRLLRRVAPIMMLGPARDAVSMFVFGYLFDRYLEQSRDSHAVRLDAGEAHELRQAIDGALTHALTTPPAADGAPAPPEDLRDGITQIVDAVIIGTAGVPEIFLRRLEAAFDELAPRGSL